MAATDAPSRLASLRPYNVAAGCLHLGQAVLILILANSFALPVRATYMTGPPGPRVGQQQVVLFNLGFAGTIAAFFGLSALAHFYVAGPGWGRYQAQLRLQRNPFRWIEYSLSASIMIVLIAMLVGISDVAALVALIGVNGSMIGFGWMQERYETRRSRTWPVLDRVPRRHLPVARHRHLPRRPGADQHPPGFVYGIFFSLFAFFNCFAINQYLQYKQIGKWKDYLFGERVYVTLSLTAKSLLAWQIFASTLASSNVV